MLQVPGEAEEDGEADDDEDLRDDDEGEAPLETIRVLAGDIGADSPDGVRRDREQLCVRGRVAHVLDDARHGELQAEVGPGGAPVDDGTQVELVVGEDGAEDGPRELLALARDVVPAVAELLAEQQEALLVIVEPVAQFRLVDEYKGHQAPEDDCDDTLYDEDPAPARVAADPVHLDNPKGEQAREGTCEGAGGIEQCDSGADLVSCVPRGDYEDCSGIESGLGKTEEESAGDQAFKVLHHTGQRHHDAPSDGHDPDPV